MQPSNCLGSSPTFQPPHLHTKIPCTHPFRERLLPNSCILPTDGSTTHFSLSPSHLRVAGRHSCSGKGGRNTCVCVEGRMGLVLTYTTSWYHAQPHTGRSPLQRTFTSTVGDRMVRWRVNAARRSKSGHNLYFYLTPPPQVPSLPSCPWPRRGPLPLSGGRLSLSFFPIASLFPRALSFHAPSGARWSGVWV